MPPDQRLADLRGGELLDLAADGSTNVGSGAVAAAAVAAAAALTAMAARRSAGWVEASAAIGQAELLRERAERLIPESSGAFDEAIGRLEDPDRASDLSDAQRDWRLGVALRRAADAPLTVAELAADVAALATHVADSCDPAARPEAFAACTLAEGAAAIAAHLVEVNLTTSESDASLQRVGAMAAEAAHSRRRLG